MQANFLNAGKKESVHWFRGPLGDGAERVDFDGDQKGPESLSYLQEIVDGSSQMGRFVLTGWLMGGMAAAAGKAGRERGVSTVSRRVWQAHSFGRSAGGGEWRRSCSSASKKAGKVLPQHSGSRMASQGAPSPSRSWVPRIAKLMAKRWSS